mmetsp:Transcript_2527/g.6089  ORF Transcript_2527/g.6089 Transcript_2527/m.6089 type:complete len:441 (+) Transcript_2527:218-1540(+)|eukprot:CAMPEP_0116090586 /NCGR_PEP_ID=MMETSP0327-20121206/7051_1 /TAXON_ID=44447 /ORGANISM="Pseudo-nitzschia delicatissima, Strain B596" /LENGTH=440 /DNA_ID=CAMNT_0003581881 /DNA_START=165 /DNA_END=1487 /DNA_ORIENTATION=+
MISAASSNTRGNKRMGSRRQIRKHAASRHRLRRWNLTNVTLVSFVFFLGFYSECSHQKHSGSINSSCFGNTNSLFAQAISVAVVGVSLDGDEKGDECDSNSGKKSTRSLQSSSSSSVANQPTIGEIFRKAGRKALGGGLPGAAAGVVQVFTLMWLRTTINYQSRYGASFFRALAILYKEGGIGRFYRGISFALFQAPLTRFVATASNDGVLALLAGLPYTKHWTPAFTTVFASLTVGLFRILLMPIDTCKTVLQVDSSEGFRALMRRVRAGKISALYQGAAATAVSSTIGHYPWFVIYNGLSAAEWLKHLIPKKLLRNASIGLVASVVSDTLVNVFRVIKTTKQTIGVNHDFTYSDTIRIIVAADGWKGLFGRGLRTRVLANSVQSILFTVIWRGLAERWGNTNETAEDGANKSSTAGVKTGVRSSLRKPDSLEEENTAN